MFNYTYTDKQSNLTTILFDNGGPGDSG